jgi:glycosyltransferase involved in cell wall biosynthesis
MSDGQRRVLHVIVPQKAGAIGGADLHVRDLAVAQRRAGDWQPLILAPRATAHYLGLLREADLPVVTPPRGVRDLAALPRRHGVTLVHAHGYEANYLLAFMRLLTDTWRSIPAAVTAHGWIETTRWLHLKSALDRRTGHTAAIAFATAHRHVHRLYHPGRTASIVVHNGIDPPAPPRLEELRRDRQRLRNRLGVPPRRFLVGTVGRLSPEKRIDLFLQAARSVAAANPAAHFLIVGGGSELPRLRNMAVAFGLDRRVTFTGLIDDTTAIYAALDVMVQPSDIEGSPRTVVEAMAHEVPVVATDVGDVAQLLDFGKAGFLIPRHDTAALSAAVLALLGNEEKARTIADLGRQHYMRHFTLDHMRRAVAEGYDLAFDRPDAPQLSEEPT